MKPGFLRFAGRVPRWTAVLVTALALGGGGAAIAPAASAGIPPNCAWQSLYLLDGWQSANSQWNTGDPAYCVDNGVVYLSGSLTQPAGSGQEFAALPPQALPTSTSYFSVYTYQGPAGNLDIQSNGWMYVWGGNSTQFTSLAGISFPVAGSALQPLSLDWDYQSANSQYGTGDPSYLVSDGAVHLAGSATSTDPSSFLADIPPGIAPDHCVETPVYTFGGTVESLVVEEYDSYLAYDANIDYSAQFTSLAGVDYPLPGSAWQPLQLKDGWTQGQQDCQAGAPSYYVNDHIVYLSGAVSHTQSGSGPVATLPLAARPSHYLFLTVSAGQKPYADVSISPNGDITVFGGSSQPVLTSLSGISFQASS